MAINYDLVDDHCDHCERKFQREQEEPEHICQTCWEDDDTVDDYFDDDQGPLDSDFGDSESDHVWADLQRSEQ